MDPASYATTYPASSVPPSRPTVVSETPNHLTTNIRNSGINMAVVSIILAVVFGIGIWWWISSPLAITVTGTGTIDVPATSASLTLTVASVDNNIDLAVLGMQNKLKGVEQILSNHQIPSSDISESEPQVVPASAVVAGAQGYQAAEALTVKTSDVAGVNLLITDLYKGGATLISQPIVTAENQDQLRQQAIDTALTQARSQAEATANRMHRFIKREVAMQIATAGTNAAATQAQASTSSGTSRNFTLTQSVVLTVDAW